MRTVYITQTWATIRRQGGLLMVMGKGGKLSEHRAQDLDQLVLMGNVTLSPQALDLLIEKGIDTVFLTNGGRYRARIAHPLSSNVKLRIAQLRKLENPEIALATAVSMVIGKCANARTFLVRFARRHGATDSLSKAIPALRASMERALLCKTLDQVRGCEGASAAAYFRAFNDLIRADGFSFDGRNRRPPMDPVNALLSMGYTLLSNVVEAAVQIVGLDPYMGALHAPEAGRPSLVCDLVEEHRAHIVDALVVSALNKRIIQVDDFEDRGLGEPVIIRREALGTFFKLFRARLDSRTTHTPIGASNPKQLTYRQIIDQQARLFARFILGEEEQYRPYAVR